MKFFLPGPAIFFGLALLLGGCASFDAHVERGRSLQGVQRFFVVSNLNDNHAFDRQITEALRARGLTAETGPLTMMPDNTQAVVTFQDRWTWDFSDHLVFLKINVRDTRSEQSFASVSFDARVPLREPTSEIIGKLVDRLFQPKAK
jgi:hypothetical protein